MRSLISTLCAAAGGILVIPGNAIAQTDQTIAMVCDGALPGHSTVTIDLAKRVISRQYEMFSVPVSIAHGAVTKVSDEEITFYLESNGYPRQGTINRRTGIFSFKNAGSLNDASCKIAQPQADLGQSAAAKPDVVTAALTAVPVSQSQAAMPAPAP